MPTTLADIARELGVSKMTISRAINNHPAINAEFLRRMTAGGSGAARMISPDAVRKYGNDQIEQHPIGTGPFKFVERVVGEKLTSAVSKNGQATLVTLDLSNEVTANDNVNPNAAGEAQPVKVCVIETNRSGWMPEGIGDGAPCRETAPSEGALSRHQSILQPRETLRYRFEVPAGQERWVVVGAEFQQISGVLPLAGSRPARLR